MEPKIHKLNERALLVRLTIRKPTTSRRDENAEVFAQQGLGDNGLRVNTTLFREKTNPVRVLLNAANAIYVYHKEHTLPYIDRGPRLLPVGQYEKYRDEMFALRNELDARLKTVVPAYSAYVTEDIASRGARASLADYPTVEQFESALQIQFTFSPLPDTSHFLFDVDEEDRRALEDQLAEVVEAAKQDMQRRIAEPLKHLIAKLRIPLGEPGAIFRDTTVENVTDAIELVRGLAMNDPEILQMCDEVKTSMRATCASVDVLRESQSARSAAADRLAAVASKMAWMQAA